VQEVSYGKQESTAIVRRMVDRKIVEKLKSQVNFSFEPQIEFLAKLVSFKTIAGHEYDGQVFCAESYDALGMNVELFEAEKAKIKSHRAYVNTDLEYNGRPNVVGFLGKSDRGRSLILNGHIDVVSPEPVSEWSIDPWSAIIRENRLYGRGSLDMKAGLSANLFALKSVLDCGFMPKGKVILQSVIEEELGGSGGTLACFLRGIIADGMIISEPSYHHIWITHPGIKYFRVKILGRPAHAALSHQGVNAIVKMIPIIKALEELDITRAETLSYPRIEEETGRSCNLSIGKMIAGDWVSTVAGWAMIECRVGFVPGESGQQVKYQIEETIKNAVDYDDWFQKHPPEIEWFGWDTEPWVEDENAPLVKELIYTSRQILKTPLRLTGAAGGLDTRFGSMFGTPSLAFGPKGANYHGIDEYVDLDSLLTVTKVLAVFIAEWCGLAE